MLCLSLTAASLSENRRAIDVYRHNIDCAELRVDRLNASEFDTLVPWMDDTARTYGIGFIVAFRVPEDGGAWAWGEQERRRMMRHLLESCSQGTILRIDIEDHIDWPEVADTAAKAGVGEIRSFHDFSGTSRGLYEHFAELRRRYPRTAVGPVVIKGAVMVQGVADLVTVFKTGKALSGPDPYILVGMGPFGVPSRILTGIWGGWLSYCSSGLPGHHAAAPGHLDPRTLSELYGFASINPRTRIFGIIGNPVAHSRSPTYHNPRFRSVGIDAVYVPFLVDDVSEFFDLARVLDIRGFSVTVPHKEVVVPYLSNIEESARVIGACNTVLKEASGWYGCNTDVPGFFKPIAEDGEQAEKKAIIVGAGGAARACTQALLGAGYSVCILNRSLERAQRLAEDFERVFPGRIASGSLPAKHYGDSVHTGADTTGPIAEAQRLCGIYGRLIVQTTSMGMEGESESSDPLWFYQFKGTEIVYDIVYTPPRTPLLLRAEAAGCHVINGQAMFDEQARLQSELFFAAARY